MGFFENNTSDLDRIRKEVRAEAKKKGEKITRAEEARRVLKKTGGMRANSKPRT